MIAAAFQVLVNVVVSGLGWIVARLAGIVTVLWRAVLVVLDQLLAWGVHLVEWIVLGVVGLFFGFLTVLAGLLPEMPDAPSGLAGTIGGALGVADRYFPVTEVLGMAALWGTIYGGLYLWKLVRFLRGGG